MKLGITYVVGVRIRRQLHNEKLKVRDNVINITISVVNNVVKNRVLLFTVRTTGRAPC